MVRNGIKSWKTHLLSSAERQDAFGGIDLAISEGLQHYGTLESISLNTSGLTVSFSVVMIGIF
jgi:hypothetical protein